MIVKSLYTIITSCFFTCQFTGVCDFSNALGNGADSQTLRIPSIVSIGQAGHIITASIAVQLDGYSFVVLAYRTPANGRNYMGIVSSRYAVVIM